MKWQFGWMSLHYWPHVYVKSDDEHLKINLVWFGNYIKYSQLQTIKIPSATLYLLFTYIIWAKLECHSKAIGARVDIRPWQQPELTTWIEILHITLI